MCLFQDGGQHTAIVHLNPDSRKFAATILFDIRSQRSRWAYTWRQSRLSSLGPRLTGGMKLDSLGWTCRPTFYETKKMDRSAGWLCSVNTADVWRQGCWFVCLPLECRQSCDSTDRPHSRAASNLESWRASRGCSTSLAPDPCVMCIPTKCSAVRIYGADLNI